LAWLPPVSVSARPVQALVHAEENGGCLAVMLLADNRILLRRQSVQTDLFGEGGEKKVTEFWIDAGLPGQVTAMTLSGEGDRLYLGTHNGYLVRFAIEPSGQARRLDATWTPERAPVTAMGLLLGQGALVVGSAYGGLSLWFPVRKEGPIAPGEWPDRLTPIRSFRSQEGEVLVLLPSQRNKAFLSLGGKGGVHLDYGTTGRHLLRLAGPSALVQAAYSSRGNAVLGIGEDNQMYLWQIAAPHADVSWSALFGRLWYEGHQESKFLWQSSGTDEPKMSLVPLVFGTLKATF
jgi:phosphate transport system permease protein